MEIEYVLTEESSQKPNKNRIKELIGNRFQDLTSDIIPVRPNKKVFELKYKISCQETTEENNDDNIYHIKVQSDHSSTKRQAELLEFFHTAFEEIIESDNSYHIIIAFDGISEYYCNRAFPKYQRFERQLRHLIFKIVTKAYGNLWTKQTLEKELKEKLKNAIKSRIGKKKEDLLIEQALYEMSMGQLIHYLFYSKEQFPFYEYIDDNYPAKKLKELPKEELIGLVEKARKPSIWNMFLADVISIEEPITKLKYLQDNRNKVAHCKFFYSEDFNKTIEYLNLFIPEIEFAISNNEIIEHLSIRDVLVGFSEYTVNLASQVSQAIAPALSMLAEIGTSITAAFQLETGRVLQKLAESVKFETNLFFEGFKPPILDTDFSKLIQLRIESTTEFDKEVEKGQDYKNEDNSNGDETHDENKNNK